MHVGLTDPRSGTDDTERQSAAVAAADCRSDDQDFTEAASVGWDDGAHGTQPTPPRPVIRVAAAVIVDDAGRLLLVRKRGTTMFMQPGGKPEVGETPAATLARELLEEVGLDLDPAGFEYLGRFDSDAANEHEHALDAEMFLVRTDQPIVAAAEIEEIAWIHPLDMSGLPIAPLVHHHVLGILRDRAAG